MANAYVVKREDGYYLESGQSPTPMFDTDTGPFETEEAAKRGLAQWGRLLDRHNAEQERNGHPPTFLGR